MIKFIKLHTHQSNRAVYVNPALITTIYVGNYSTIICMLDNDDYTHVKETPEEILAMIEKCNITGNATSK